VTPNNNVQHSSKVRITSKSHIHNGDNKWQEPLTEVIQALLQCTMHWSPFAREAIFTTVHPTTAVPDAFRPAYAPLRAHLEPLIFARDSIQPVALNVYFTMLQYDIALDTQTGAVYTNQCGAGRNSKFCQNT
jgi:hypothetical protein